jgi:large subunit ribosomal protein L16
MLSPKRTKFRKQMRGKNRGLAWRGSALAFGEFALQATGAVRLTARQIEAGRMAIQRAVKRQGQLWIRVFPDKPVTRKPLEVRMGGGKGAVDQWVALIKPGRILFELAGVQEDVAREAFHLAATKLPVETRFLGRESWE